ncbi:tellurite resistance TerB family protein [Pararhizobium mangrovi]|uniref:Tellurite resistance TerB family protein n=1 Tax=Pararhizobium mangrovi TaxID=2590452 RepID=A0A506U8E4_9HYPH|nr:tellurite resistance TerB family protein [Pararhizobium mangrovi]TPW30692.1 tellurite resistance TerB family protein [Pararhizobium mangrovi]
MFDAKRLLDQLVGGQTAAGSTGNTNPSGGAGGQGDLQNLGTQAMDMIRRNPGKAGLLAAGLLGTGFGRKLAGSALRYGGMAAIAGLGYHAYQNYKSGNRPGAGNAGEAPEKLPARGETGFHVDAEDTEPEFALLLVRGMIAAAASDGHIDDQERQRILGRLEESDLEGDARSFLQKEIDEPADIDTLVSGAKTEEQKVELYTASRLAVEPDTRAERGYLDLLAGRLGLPDDLVEHIEATVSSAES